MRRLAVGGGDCDGGCGCDRRVFSARFDGVFAVWRRFDLVQRGGWCGGCVNIVVGLVLYARCPRHLVQLFYWGLSFCSSGLTRLCVVFGGQGLCMWRGLRSGMHGGARMDTASTCECMHERESESEADVPACTHLPNPGSIPTGSLVASFPPSCTSKRDLANFHQHSLQSLHVDRAACTYDRFWRNTPDFA